MITVIMEWVMKKTKSIFLHDVSYFVYLYLVYLAW